MIEPNIPASLETGLSPGKPRAAAEAGAPGFSLVQVANGSWSLRSHRDGEVFHPVIGPVAEAEALYVQQLNLPARVSAAKEPFVLWDIGLGAAANALTAIRSVAHVETTLRLFSFDHTLEPLAFALEHAGTLGFPSGFEVPLGKLLKTGSVRFVHGSCRVDWRLKLGDFPHWVQACEPMGAEEVPRAILYDAYSPRKNPTMWAKTHFQSLRSLLRVPCVLATYSRSTRLRVSLLLAGYYVGIGHATGFKEETTVAATELDLLDRPLAANWLTRVRRSTAAAPFTAEGAPAAPLSDEDWDRLVRHPQFQNKP